MEYKNIEWLSRVNEPVSWGHVIGQWDTLQQKIVNEFYVKEVKENVPYGIYFGTRGLDPVPWDKGDYLIVAAVRGEWD